MPLAPPLTRLVVLPILLGLLPLEAAAQDAPARYPETGLAILDCDPTAPAPAASCLLRLPVGFDYADTDTSALGETSG